MDISRPEVENSHTPATTEAISRPSGEHGGVTPRAGQPLDGPTPGEEAAGRADQADDDRQPFEGHEGQHLVQAGQGEQPQRVRVDLDPLAEVEDEAVAGQQVVDDPEVDEGVLVDPPVEPGAHQHDDQRGRGPATTASGPTAGRWWRWSGARRRGGAGTEGAASWGSRGRRDGVSPPSGVVAPAAGSVARCRPMGALPRPGPPTAPAATTAHRAMIHQPARAENSVTRCTVVSNHGAMAPVPTTRAPPTATRPMTSPAQAHRSLAIPAAPPGAATGPGRRRPPPGPPGPGRGDRGPCRRRRPGPGRASRRPGTGLVDSPRAWMTRMSTGHATTTASSTGADGHRPPPPPAALLGGEGEEAPDGDEDDEADGHHQALVLGQPGHQDEDQGHPLVAGGPDPLLSWSP